MPYFPILQKPTQNNLITKTSFRRDAPSPQAKKPPKSGFAPTAQYITIAKKPPKSGFINVTLGCPIVAMHHRHRRKTAEERLYTSTHSRFALSRRRATALFHNPVCKAQRSVPGFSSTPTSACRRYATSPPSAVASHIIRHPSDCPIVRHHHRIAPTAQYTTIGEKPPKSGFIR